ncbi:angiopoietin-related protein 3 [Gadus morhua]|uniref:angiopoietin-related protein 3 n=1 Tax=Gadus morhua TaxID=8049 RepID=UPI0011B61BD4|nr:angiopoietin-related protein 3 [Gadus morhua]
MTKLGLFLLLPLLVSSTYSLPNQDSSGMEEYPTLPSHALTQAPTTTEAKSRFAMLDDVRLLANGLLQLGQSLREFVHKTKSQINDIFVKLNIFDRSFYQLSVVTSEIKEEEEELKKTTNFLKTDNEEIKNLSLEINSKINGILQERGKLQSKVGILEERLQGLSKSVVPPEQLREMASLKEVIDSQEKTITDLLIAVREQHDQLDYQKTKIKNLEEKMNTDNFQDTIEKDVDTDSENSDMFDYLTGNSTVMETKDIPTDCSELFNRGEKNSGVYTIMPNGSEPFNVYCKMNLDGGSTVIQHRVDGSVDFDQTWEKYEFGFGDLQKEYWLGLRKIHSLAMQRNSILHVELVDSRNERRWVEYQFLLGGPTTNYAIYIRRLAGDLPDTMANHTGTSFFTKDRENLRDVDCIHNYTGGWWFSACGDTNLNGRYVWLRGRGRQSRRRGIQWKSSTGAFCSLKTTTLSIRPAPWTDHFN